MPAPTSLKVWIEVFLAVALDGCAALVAGLIPEAKLARLQHPLLGFTAGVLIATAFLDLLPEALAGLPPLVALATLVGALVTMGVLEWTVGHRVTSRTGTGRLAPVLLGADAFHNAADGGAIAAAFLNSPRLGMMAAAAVIIHEVPEEVAAYVLLRRAGLSRARALLAMTGVQLTAAVGALAILLGAAIWQEISAFALAAAAGTFVHISEVDLIPAVIAQAGSRRQRAVAALAFLAGIGIVAALTLI